MHFEARLRKRDRPVAAAEEGIRLPVPAHKAEGALFEARPEDGVARVERISLRPHGKERVDKPKRIGG